MKRTYSLVILTSHSHPNLKCNSTMVSTISCAWIRLHWKWDANQTPSSKRTHISSNRQWWTTSDSDSNEINWTEAAAQVITTTITTTTTKKKNEIVMNIWSKWSDIPREWLCEFVKWIGVDAMCVFLWYPCLYGEYWYDKVCIWRLLENKLNANISFREIHAVKMFQLVTQCSQIEWSTVQSAHCTKRKRINDKRHQQPKNIKKKKWIVTR